MTLKLQPESKAITPLNHFRNSSAIQDTQETNAISAEIYLPRREKYDTRQILDTILAKLGSGTAWQKLNYQGLNFPTVQTTYQRMVSDGRWAELTALLQATRGSVPT